MTQPPCDYLACAECAAAGRRFGERVEWHAQRDSLRRRARFLAYLSAVLAAVLAAVSLPVDGLAGIALGLSSIGCAVTSMVRLRRLRGAR